MADIKEVYRLLVDNRPYVGLNSKYTYFLLAKDFSKTCVVASYRGVVIGLSSGFIPPDRNDTLFNWEAVVHKDFRGNQLQKRMLLHQIRNTDVRFFEATTNPSNRISRKNFKDIAQLLHARYEETMLFTEEDFEYDGHEPEILLRVGPIERSEIERNMDFAEKDESIKQALPQMNTVL